MRPSTGELWAWCLEVQRTKFFRYIAGSVITTIVSFAVLTFVYGIVAWGAVASTVLANVVATVPAYWLNRTWTWGKAGRSDLWREVLPFWVLSVAGIVISTGTAALAADFARHYHFHHLLSVVVIDGANLAAYGVLFIGKYVVFNKMFKVAESVRLARLRRWGAAAASLGADPGGASQPLWLKNGPSVSASHPNASLRLGDEVDAEVLDGKNLAGAGTCMQKRR